MSSPVRIHRQELPHLLAAAQPKSFRLATSRTITDVTCSAVALSRYVRRCNYLRVKLKLNGSSPVRYRLRAMNAKRKTVQVWGQFIAGTVHSVRAAAAALAAIAQPTQPRLEAIEA